MSMKMVCNRCNKVKEDGESFDHIDYMPTLKEYDLCPECSKKFERFMNGCEVEEEDHYKDSKPCAVVIHKLASGHYGIESVPDKKKVHCGTCAYQWDAIKCPRAKETPGTISCENDAEACDEWVPEVDMFSPSPSIDKEESDLSVKTHKVTCPTTGETVTVPDSEPWVCAGTGGE